MANRFLFYREVQLKPRVFPIEVFNFFKLDLGEAPLQEWFQIFSDWFNPEDIPEQIVIFLQWLKQSHGDLVEFLRLYESWANGFRREVELKVGLIESRRKRKVQLFLKRVQGERGSAGESFKDFLWGLNKICRSIEPALILDPDIWKLCGAAVIGAPGELQAEEAKTVVLKKLVSRFAEIVEQLDNSAVQLSRVAALIQGPGSATGRNMLSNLLQSRDAIQALEDFPSIALSMTVSDWESYLLVIAANPRYRQRVARFIAHNFDQVQFNSALVAVLPWDILYSLCIMILKDQVLVEKVYQTLEQGKDEEKIRVAFLKTTLEIRLSSARLTKLIESSAESLTPEERHFLAVFYSGHPQLKAKMAPYLNPAAHPQYFEDSEDPYTDAFLLSFIDELSLRSALELLKHTPRFYYRHRQVLIDSLLKKERGVDAAQVFAEFFEKSSNLQPFFDIFKVHRDLLFDIFRCSDAATIHAHANIFMRLFKSEQADAAAASTADAASEENIDNTYLDQLLPGELANIVGCSEFSNVVENFVAQRIKKLGQELKENRSVEQQSEAIFSLLDILASLNQLTPSTFDLLDENHITEHLAKLVQVYANNYARAAFESGETIERLKLEKSLKEIPACAYLMQALYARGWIQLNAASLFILLGVPEIPCDIFVVHERLLLSLLGREAIWRALSVSALENIIRLCSTVASNDLKLKIGLLFQQNCVALPSLTLKFIRALQRNPMLLGKVRSQIVCNIIFFSELASFKGLQSAEVFKNVLKLILNEPIYLQKFVRHMLLHAGERSPVWWLQERNALAFFYQHSSFLLTLKREGGETFFQNTSIALVGNMILGWHLGDKEFFKNTWLRSISFDRMPELIDFLANLVGMGRRPEILQKVIQAVNHFLMLSENKDYLEQRLHTQCASILKIASLNCLEHIQNDPSLKGVLKQKISGNTFAKDELPYVLQRNPDFCDYYYAHSADFPGVRMGEITPIWVHAEKLPEVWNEFSLSDASTLTNREDESLADHVVSTHRFFNRSLDLQRYFLSLESIKVSADKIEEVQKMISLSAENALTAATLEYKCIHEPEFLFYFLFIVKKNPAVINTIPASVLCRIVLLTRLLPPTASWIDQFSLIIQRVFADPVLMKIFIQEMIYARLFSEQSLLWWLEERRALPMAFRQPSFIFTLRTVVEEMKLAVDFQRIPILLVGSMLTGFLKQGVVQFFKDPWLKSIAFDRLPELVIYLEKAKSEKQALYVQTLIKQMIAAVEQIQSILAVYAPSQALTVSVSDPVPDVLNASEPLLLCQEGGVDRILGVCPLEPKPNAFGFPIPRQGIFRSGIKVVEGSEEEWDTDEGEALEGEALHPPRMASRPSL